MGGGSGGSRELMEERQDNVNRLGIIELSGVSEKECRMPLRKAGHLF
jgi:hypothetical protein